MHRTEMPGGHVPSSERVSAADLHGQLRDLIAGGELRPGGRLPPERSLAERLKVNRATLRKALARLEAEGAITRHVGRGTFVGKAPLAPDAIAGTASPMELMDARLTLEPVMAKEAALRARKEDLKALQLCMVRFDQADQYAEFEEWDVAFHRAIAEATQNPILVMVMEVMRRTRSTEEWDRLKRASFTPALRDQYRDEHRLILRALEMRDQAGAAAAMFKHMQTVRMAISGTGSWVQSLTESHPGQLPAAQVSGQSPAWPAP